MMPLFIMAKTRLLTLRPSTENVPIGSHIAIPIKKAIGQLEDGTSF